MSIWTYRVLAVLTVGLACGAVVLAVSARFEIRMLPAAVVWCISSAAWVYGLYRCFGEPRAEDLAQERPWPSQH